MEKQLKKEITLKVNNMDLTFDLENINVFITNKVSNQIKDFGEVDLTLEPKFRIVIKTEQVRINGELTLQQLLDAIGNVDKTILF